MSALGFLCFAIGSITTMSVGGTALPLWLGGTGRWNAVAIDVLTFFTGGVFLGAGMLHMIPEAARQAEKAGITSPLLNPFTCFCVGYLLVYVIEQHQHSQLTKEGLLAVAQRARSNAGTASICVVDVPPVTTYHVTGQHLSGRLSSGSSHLQTALLEQPQQGATAVDAAAGGGDSYGHKVDSYSHGYAPHAPGSPPPQSTGHGHGHGHAHEGDCCGDAKGTADEHSHGGRLEPGLEPGLEPRLEPAHADEHGHTHAHPAGGGPGSGHSGHSHSPPPPRPPWPTHESSSGNGWYDENGCECPSHDHVHPGVRHKHLAVGSASATFPLVRPPRC